MKNEKSNQNFADFSKIKSIPTILLLYMLDSDFKEDIDALRDKYEIKIFDHEFDESFVEFDKKILIDTNFRNDYFKDIKSLSQKYLFEECFEELEMFIESGDVPYTWDESNFDMSSKFSYLRVRPREDKGENLPGIGLYVSFVIRRPIQNKDLENWFDKIKEEILVASNDYFSGYKHSCRNSHKSGKAFEIIRLKYENPKMTFEEIADKLYNYVSKKYPNHSDLNTINAESVKRLYYYYSDIIKKEHSKK